MANAQLSLRRNSPPPSDHKWDTLVSKLNLDCVAEMGNLLSMTIGNNYKDLAGLLNFTLPQVERMQRHSSTNPGRCLLNTWAQREGTTARCLRRALEQLGRHDVIKLLENSLNDPVSLVVVVKDEENNSILYDDVIPSYGEEKVRDALLLAEGTRRLFPLIPSDPDKNPLEDSAGKYKGKQITLLRSRSGDSENPICFVQEHHQSVRCEYESLQSGPEGGTDPTTNYKSPSNRTAELPTTLEVRPQRQQPDGACSYSGATDGQRPTTNRQRSPADHSPPLMDLPRSPPVSAQLSSERLTSQTLPKTPMRNTNGIPPATNVYTAEKRVFQSTNSQTHRKHLESPTRSISPVPKATPDKYSPTKYNAHSMEYNDSDGYEETGLSESLNLMSEDCGEYLTTELPRNIDKDLPGFHENATNNNIIQHLFLPYLHEDGAYIIRPSRDDPHVRSISVVFEGSVVNYRVHNQRRIFNSRLNTQYYLFDGEDVFSSLAQLINFYKRNQLKSCDEFKGPILKRPL